MAPKFRQPLQCIFPLLKALFLPSFSTHPLLSLNSQRFQSKMGKQDQITSPKTNEPLPKLQKTNQNGISTGSPNLLFLLRVKRLSENASFPSKGSPLLAGYDLSSSTSTTVPAIPARGKVLVPTDLSIGIPEGTYARIAPRSSLAWKHSIDVGASVIDVDYRGSVGVILFNHSDVDFEVKQGDRIAQLIIERIMTPEVLEVEDLDATVRGMGGFGSIGV